MPQNRVYEVWRIHNGKLEMCINPVSLQQILQDGYILCEATLEMVKGGLVGEDCRQVAIPRDWVTGAASPGDWVDSNLHWRPRKPPDGQFQTL